MKNEDQILHITDAYESGIGHGFDNLPNPYKPGSDGAIAYDMGREIAKARGIGKPESEPMEALRSQAGAVPANFPEGMSEKTADLVVRFSLALAEKLHAADEKYGYGHSWIETDWEKGCIEDLHHHLAKGDPRDVAAYCAFMWHHGWSTTAAPPSPAADERVREWLLPDDLEQLIRFYGYVSDADSGGYMNSKEAVKRLAELGCVKWCGGSRYEVTRFGEWIVESHATKNPAELPLITCADFNARSHKEMTERNAALAARKADGNGGEG